MKNAAQSIPLSGEPKANHTWLLVISALIIALPGCHQLGGGQGISEGSQAPEITGVDAQGNPVKLSQFQGKVVLLDFWATWCGPCINEIPHELDLHHQYAGRPFAILGISRDQDLDKLKAFLVQRPLPWPNVFDGSGNIADQWGIGPIPTFILIDHNGIIRNKWVGGGQINQIRAAVDQAVRAAEKK